MQQAVRMNVFGRVQGVGFRWAARQLAERLNIKGYVVNKDDGSVLIEAQGEQADLRKFMAQVEIGPSNGTKVHHVMISSLEVNPEHTVFKIY
ncbi:hypothetical protein IV73_GL001199 [Weissella kandleri]|uniref:acylphosphatase n=1 Tax=Weissella kandleri TaxID=1616 RepID=A0A0R2JHM8_9LACO|nr:acylphosphatase [Weissella kandleri]KRN74693.1 hypothetical protein IV73_GL001199 [Weissella kandleri]